MSLISAVMGTREGDLLVRDAAPELLAALKIARELLDRNDIRRPEIDAAIAKAEGR